MLANRHILGKIALHFRGKVSRGFLLGLLFIAAIYIYMLHRLGIDPMAPGRYDSYTLQALAWRNGTLDLGCDYPNLELAFYCGKIYVCFPPVPAIPMFLLSYFFGGNTPSLWLMIVGFFGSYVLCYGLGRRFGNDDVQSACWAAFLVCGSNFIDISLLGWVWYMAQSCSFFFTLLAFFLVSSVEKREHAWGLIAIALAVGCRPMQIVYVPILMGMVWQKTQIGKPLKVRIIAFASLLVLPALIGLGYAAYNAIRFGDPFEFGYNYLPEFQENPQFGFAYIPNHLKKLLFDFPSVQQGQLIIPDFDGFAFYIANPIFITLVIRLFRSRHVYKKNEMILLASIVLHFLMLMMHRTFGGWQFGTRYLLDTLPAVIYLCLKAGRKLTTIETPILVFAIVFNVVGSLMFRSAYSQFLLAP